MFLNVLPVLLKTIQADPSLRPAFMTAMQYWLVEPELKMVYRPGRQSRYRELLRKAIKHAPNQQRSELAQIAKLGDAFVPILH